MTTSSSDHTMSIEIEMDAEACCRAKHGKGLDEAFRQYFVDRLKQQSGNNSCPREVFDHSVKWFAEQLYKHFIKDWCTQRKLDYDEYLIWISVEKKHMYIFKAYFDECRAQFAQYRPAEETQKHPYAKPIVFENDAKRQRCECIGSMIMSNHHS